MTTVWVTRTRPGAESTADRVRAVGFQPLVAPLLEVVFEAGGDIDLTNVERLAFTSANGARAFAGRSTERSLPVFAVGRGTAKAARETGFTSVTASDGDVMALARAIPHGGLVLHAGAEEQAADLVLALERRGMPARGIVVYRTTVATLSESEVTAAAASDFVLLHSVKAARAYWEIGLGGPRPICLSPAVASATAVPGRVAAAPTEDALIAALVEARR